jgi:lambda family phage tail tape measure protein
MADVNVSLGLEDSKFKQGIANAQTQAQRLGSSLSTAFGGGNNALNRLGSGLDAVNVRFQNLGRAIVGVGLSAFVVQALRSADALSDLSAALGVNTARLMEMNLAAGGAGGNLESLSGMLGRLEDNLQGAIDGNQKMRDSLREVGIGYDEITQLNPDQIFNRIARALAGMTDSNKRAALSSELLGKSARLMDWNGYTSTINKVNGTMDEHAKAVDAAGKMMDEFAQTAQLVAAEFLNLVGPIIDFLTPLNETSSKMDRAKVAAVALAGALALMAGSTIIRGIVGIVGAAGQLATIFGIGAGAAATNTLAVNANTIATYANANAQAFMAGAVGRVGTAFTAVTIAEARYNAALLAHGVASAEAIAADSALTAARARLAEATAAAAVTQGVLTGATEAGTVANAANAASGVGILGWLGKYAKALSLAAVALGALTYSSSLNAGEAEWEQRNLKAAELLKRRKDALAQLSEAEKARYNALSQDQKNAVIDSIVSQQEMKKQQDLINSVYGTSRPSGSGFKETDAEKKARIELASAINTQKTAMDNLLGSVREKNSEQIEELNRARENIGLSERERTIKKEVLEFENRFRDNINKLREQEAQLIAESGSEDEQTRNKAIAQLPIVRQTIEQLTKAREGEVEVIKETAAATYDSLNAERNRASIAQFTAEQRIQSEQKVRDLQDEMAKMSMTEIEKKYYDIEAAARNAALAKIASLNEENRANGRALLTEQEKLDIMKAANVETNRLKTLTRQNYEASRTFSAGWNKAMREYVENATNAATRAENIFRTATQGMEEAIVNFAKTGKFEWRNFVQMMLEELLRAQIQQVFAQLMGTMSNTMRGAQGSMLGGGIGGIGGGGGGLFSGLGSILGSLFGGGGGINPSTNPMVIGGGIGGGGIGDTFGNILGNITGSLGGIVSGIGSGIGSVVKGIGSGISSVVSGIGNFFGGFFADGGYLPAGKFGIVGERGPEMITGPANITPMGLGGTTNVVYNINAVDAASFKQLVAQDPSFIYAVTQQGARSVNGTRR